MSRLNLLLLSILGLISTDAFAEGIPHFINYYDLLVVKTMGLDKGYMVTAGGLLATVIIILVGLHFKGSVEKSLDDVTPSDKFSLRVFVEAIMDFVTNLTKDQVGDHGWKPYVVPMAGIFIFILTCNLTGLIPGFPPPTETMTNNVAIGIVAFLVYNYAGVKEHGGAYIKQFMGPVIFIAPLFFFIELFSHFSRPLSLGLRLMGNIYGDHLLVGVFTGLTYAVFPAALLFFGLLVAFMQSFVFTLLTGIYIGMAKSHDH